MHRAGGTVLHLATVGASMKAARRDADEKGRGRTHMKPKRRRRAALKALAGAAALAAAPIARASRAPIFVLNSLDADVSVIDAETFSEIKRIPTGKEPHHLMRTPDGSSLIVANAISNDLHFLDPLTGQIQRRMRGFASVSAAWCRRTGNCGPVISAFQPGMRAE